MSSATLPVLDLALLPDVRQPKGRRRPRLAVLSVILVAVVSATGFAAKDRIAGLLTPAAGQAVPIDRAETNHVAEMSVDDRAQLLAQGKLAQTRNAAIPFTAPAPTPMRPFHLAASTASASTALKCLTQAIYYEAATEPLEGRRAVAQVVLNRVRHPAYPKSVCGVVYQGAERTTGCQFSFTCDGSLLRAPIRRPWLEAGEIARAALAGRVETSVGTATHYHADYVLPRWAFELGKITQLGRHLFYRFEGTWGTRQFFAGAYSANETIPVFDLMRLRARLLAAGAGGDSSVEPLVKGLTVPAHVTDRHAENDVGGRIDTTREWRLTIPDPTQASARYRAVVDGAAPAGSTSLVAAPQFGEAAQ